MLHSFTGADGSFPSAPAIEGFDGNLYGTTSGGGGPGATIYKFTASGVFTTIYTLTEAEGTGISAPLLQARDASLYAVSPQGGANGCGSILHLTTGGTKKNLKSFDCGSGGSSPLGSLVQAADGTLYGTTIDGGAYGQGTIYKLASTGAIAVLYSFGASSTDGLHPVLGLTQGSDGNFYGSTQSGGIEGGGSIYQFTPSGFYTQVYSFPLVNSVPVQPEPPTQHTAGLFYGVTIVGGANALGSVYTLDMGLAPFVAFVRAQGKVGASAQILGTGLTGATSVTFNGVPAASFSVSSDTYMTAVVPTGATTGPVVVTTPGGALTSNVSFRITQ